MWSILPFVFLNYHVMYFIFCFSESCDLFYCLFFWIIMWCAESQYFIFCFFELSCNVFYILFFCIIMWCILYFVFLNYHVMYFTFYFLNYHAWYTCILHSVFLNYHVMYILFFWIIICYILFFRWSMWNFCKECGKRKCCFFRW